MFYSLSTRWLCDLSILFPRINISLMFVQDEKRNVIFHMKLSNYISGIFFKNCSSVSSNFGATLITLLVKNRIILSAAYVRVSPVPNRWRWYWWRRNVVFLLVRKFYIFFIKANTRLFILRGTCFIPSIEERCAEEIWGKSSRKYSKQWQIVIEAYWTITKFA